MHRYHLPGRNKNSPEGFTLIETLIVVVIIIILTGIGVPSFKHIIASDRLQEVAWQIVQDLCTVKEDAILYQQDLNVYFDYNNFPVEPTNPANKNNRHYLFETFKYNLADPQLHYIPTDSLDNHFFEKVLKYDIVIDSITPTSSQISIGGKKYFVLTFRSGAGSTFRGQIDVTSAMSGRNNTTSTIIGTNKVVIKITDPNSNLSFYVIVDGVGNISMNGSPPS